MKSKSTWTTDITLASSAKEAALSSHSIKDILQVQIGPHATLQSIPSSPFTGTNGNQVLSERLSVKDVQGVCPDRSIFLIIFP